MPNIDIEISSRKGAILEKQIQDFCDHQKRVTCKGLSKRPIFLGKYLECMLKKRDKTQRMQLFFCAIALFKKVGVLDISSQKIIDGKRCFEFLGVSKCGQEFGIHIREETIEKDKKLFLISTFSA
ncbi:MAG: hypothetical protein Q8K26_04920 [Candidatus Gracilibacteria bacterium]|nr:hypothetical protein [Candidatus Gracilibacteria bacterium]